MSLNGNLRRGSLSSNKYRAASLRTHPRETVGTNPPHEQTLPGVLADPENIPGVVKEHTAWDVYNNEAKKVDAEMVKDWMTSLNSLLLFTAIFAAVLTAFVIESKKMLEPDWTALLLKATIFSMQHAGNLSSIQYTPPQFEVTSTAVSINCLLFASLGASLVAALASVIALQWVADYDAAITRGGSSPEDRAKRRQFRFAGVVRWKMGEIIAALPILLYSSVILFWSGVVQWLWTIEPIVGYVVASGTALAVLFITFTSFLSALYVSAPFRTPLSRGLYWVYMLSSALLYESMRMIKGGLSPLLGWFRQSRFISRLYIRSSAIIAWIRGFLTWTTSRRWFIDWVKDNLLPAATSRQREAFATDTDKWIKQKALVWLSQQLNLSIDSRRRLLLLLGEVTRLSSAEQLSPSFTKASWLEILDFLGSHYLWRVLYSQTVEEDFVAVGILVRCSQVPEVLNAILPEADYEVNSSKADYWTQYCFSSRELRNIQIDNSPNMTFTLSRDIPVPSAESMHELKATAQLIKWRNSTGLKNNSTWDSIFHDVQYYSPGYLESCLRCFQQVVICSLDKRAYETSFTQEHSRLVVFDPKTRTFMERTDLEPIFSTIMTAVQNRSLTRGEVLALMQVFEIWITRQTLGFSDELTPTSAIRRPLLYGALLSYMLPHHREAHYELTILMARVVASLPKAEQPQWKRSIIMMLWLGRLKPVNYWYNLIATYGEHAEAMVFWNVVEMKWSGHVHEIPHSVEIVNILDRLTGVPAGIEPIWLSSRNLEIQRKQVIYTIEAFDRMLGEASEPGQHAMVVRLLCHDMGAEGQRWPRNPVYTEELSQRLVNIRDPCLALLCAYACGVAGSVKLALTSSYTSKYSDSLDIFNHLVYRTMSLLDAPETWQLCAVLSFIADLSVQRICREALLDPGKLSYLQLVFQYPIQCPSHSSGSHHILLHLYESVRPMAGFRQELVLFGKVRITGEKHNPILCLLSLPEGEDPSSLIFHDRYNRECIERLWVMCQVVKNDAAAIIALITELAAKQTVRVCTPGTVAMILEPIRQKMQGWNLGETSRLLLPLASAIRTLRTRMLVGLPMPGSTKDRKVIAAEAHHIYRYLQSISATNHITSAHGRILSCARATAGSVAQPADCWLAMHLDL